MRAAFILIMFLSTSVHAELLEIIATGQTGIPTRGTFGDKPELQKLFYPGGELPLDLATPINVEVKVVVDTEAVLIAGDELQSPVGLPASVSFYSGEVITEQLTGRIELLNFDGVKTRFILTGYGDHSVLAGGLTVENIILNLYIPIVAPEDWPTIPSQIEDLIGEEKLLGAVILADFHDRDGNRGRVEVRPSVTLGQKIKIISEASYECSAYISRNETLGSRYINDSKDPAQSFSWIVNGVNHYSGESPDIELKLGENVVNLMVGTVSGETYNDTVSITVLDSRAPEVSLLVDRLPGNQKGGTGRYYVDYKVSDICDPNPKVSASAGVDVSGGAQIVINQGGIRSEYGDKSVLFSVFATDESGNTTLQTQVVNE